MASWRRSLRSGRWRWRRPGLFSVVLTHSISLLFLPDPLHDVPEELDNLLLTLLRRLEDVEDGLGGRLVL